MNSMSVSIITIFLETIGAADLMFRCIFERCTWVQRKKYLS